MSPISSQPHAQKLSRDKREPTTGLWTARRPAPCGRTGDATARPCERQRRRACITRKLGSPRFLVTTERSMQLLQTCICPHASGIFSNGLSLHYQMPVVCNVLHDAQDLICQEKQCKDNQRFQDFFSYSGDFLFNCAWKFDRLELFQFELSFQKSLFALFYYSPI